MTEAGETHATRSGAVVQLLAWTEEEWSGELAATISGLERQPDVLLWAGGGTYYELWRYTGTLADATRVLRRVRWRGWPQPRWRAALQGLWVWTARAPGMALGVTLGMALSALCFWIVYRLTGENILAEAMAVPADELLEGIAKLAGLILVLVFALTGLASWARRRWP